MIETKEQYEKLLLDAMAWTSGKGDVVLQQRAGEALQDGLETIEALLEVVRAGQKLERDMPVSEIEIARESGGNTNANLVLFRHATLSEALIALPDWITE